MPLNPSETVELQNMAGSSPICLLMAEKLALQMKLHEQYAPWTRTSQQAIADLYTKINLIDLAIALQVANKKLTEHNEYLHGPEH
jgi:hypothetical protein